MSQVNRAGVRVPNRLGRKAISLDKRRVSLSTRILPSTMEYLESLVNDETGMKCDTHGRAIDFLVRAVRHPGIVEQLTRTGKLRAINLAG